MIDYKSETPEAVQLSTREAAHVLAVHESTIKRWCNRDELDYELTGGGHRRISLISLMELARNRNLETPLAWFRGFESSVYLAVTGCREGSHARALDLVTSWIDENRVGYVYRFTRYLESESVAWADVCDRIIAPMLWKIGDDWKASCLTIDEEHYFTEVVNDVVQFRRYERYSAEESNEPIAVAVLGCPGNELHEIGLLMTQTILEESGWRVIYLGPNIPVYELSQAQKKYRARMVCISISECQGSLAFSHTAETLARFYDSAKPYTLVMGGPAVGEANVSRDNRESFDGCLMFDRISPFRDWVADITEGQFPVTV